MAHDDSLKPVVSKALKKNGLGSLNASECAATYNPVVTFDMRILGKWGGVLDDVGMLPISEEQLRDMMIISNGL